MNEFETAVVNEPSVFEPLKFYGISNLNFSYIEQILLTPLPHFSFYI